MKQEFLKPAEGSAPRHPVTNRRIDPKGEMLDVTPAIARMIQDGDLVVVETELAETKPEKTSKSKKAKESK